MRELIKVRKKIDFSKHFPATSLLSGSLVIACLALLIVKGLNYGVDFRGGAEIQAKFQKKVMGERIRQVLKDSGQAGPSVQSIGAPEENEFLIKVRADEEGLNQVTQVITQVLTKNFKDEGAEIRKTDIVGPKAGAELRTSGFQAMAFALLFIMIYIGVRFDFKYSPGAIAALTHDCIIILGIFALSGKEFTLQIVAALLAVIGYSVNDTVVVYDRVREHEESHEGRKLVTHINSAVNETLSRTVLTSCTTLFISVSMFIWGGKSIHDFFFAVSLGVLVGTYSSIYIAAPVTLFFDKMKK